MTKRATAKTKITTETIAKPTATTKRPPKKTKKPTLSTVLDPFFLHWGDQVIEWWKKTKERYKAEYREYWNKFDPEGKGSMSPTKESNAAHRELMNKWTFLLGREGLWAVQHDKMEKIAERVRKDMERKKLALIAKVEEKVGKIVEVDLHVGSNREPNGLVVGTNGKVVLDTISAGGYNIQCFHYRTLIKPVKEEKEPKKTKAGK
jgi:hypothetical protein